MTLSHGYLQSYFSASSILEVKTDCESFINGSIDYSGYLSNVETIIPSVKKIIDSASLRSLASRLLRTERPILCTTELHTQFSEGISIPPHQDNFYHCISSGNGVKILVPLSNLNLSNGALSYYDVPFDHRVLKHVASTRRNFSSFIPPDIVAEIPFSTTCYDLNIGDISYHFLNSIHFSHSNGTSTPASFLVFRFHHQDAIQSPEMLKEYSIVYNQHLVLTGNIKKV